MRQIRIARPDAGIDGLDVVEVEKPCPAPARCWSACGRPR